MDNKLTLGERFQLKDVVMGIRCLCYSAALIIGYCIYWAVKGYANALLKDIAGIIAVTLVLCIIQELLKANFDEKDRLTGRDYIVMLFSAAAYGVASYFLNWFDGVLIVSIGCGVFSAFLNMWAYFEFKKFRAALAKKRMLEEK